jgi:hypothetical protein
MPEEIMDQRSELARRLCAALMSKRLGIGMDYALKKYAKDAGESEYWLDLAGRVEREFVEYISAAIDPTPRILPPDLAI